jgi:hypothetical protein
MEEKASKEFEENARRQAAARAREASPVKGKNTPYP